MTKSKQGLYAQWFTVIGYNKRGNICHFLIYANQAKTYAQAVKFWNKTWGSTCKALVLRNAEPYSDCLAWAC